MAWRAWTWAAGWACFSGYAQEISGFRVPDYDAEGNLKSQLYGDYAQIRPNDEVEITNLKIETFGKGSDPEMLVTSPHCVYNRQSGSARSESALRIARDNMIITGEGYVWDSGSERFVIRRKARVVLKNAAGNIKKGTEP
jgi:hypothetical protein